MDGMERGWRERENGWCFIYGWDGERMERERQRLLFNLWMGWREEGERDNGCCLISVYGNLGIHRARCAVERTVSPSIPQSPIQLLNERALLFFLLISSSTLSVETWCPLQQTIDLSSM